MLLAPKISKNLRQSTDSRDSPYICPRNDCKFLAKTNYCLKKHVEGHKDCEYCGKTFYGGNAARDIHLHLKKHERVKLKPVFKCEFCNKIFKKNYGKMRHQKSGCRKIDLKSLNSLRNIRGGRTD